MNEEGRKEFGAYLKKLRLQRELSQKDAAGRAGISGPYLAQLERGERNPPSRRILSTLAVAYVVPLKEITQLADQAEGGGKKQLDAAQIEWAFQAATSDPAFTFGHRARAGALTAAQKAFFIEMYEKSTGKTLIVEPPQEAVEEEVEVITQDEP